MKRDLLKAIKLKCLECCGGSKKEVRLCGAKDCPLWLFRKGSDPLEKKKYGEDELKKRAARLRR